MGESLVRRDRIAAVDGEDVDPAAVADSLKRRLNKDPYELADDDCRGVGSESAVKHRDVDPNGRVVLHVPGQMPTEADVG